MIDLQVKSREPIVMDAKMKFILSQMPVKVSMKVNRKGILSYKGYMDGERGLIITKEERDIYGNIMSLNFAKVPSGVCCQWEDRDKYPYPSDDKI